MNVRRNRNIVLSSCHRTHINFVIDGIHSDSIAESAPSFLLEGLPRNNRDFLSAFALKIYTNSSVNEDLPAPPVPVIPMMEY